MCYYVVVFATECSWVLTYLPQYFWCPGNAATWHSLEQYCSIIHLLHTISNARSFTFLQWKHTPSFGLFFLASKCIFFRHEHVILFRKNFSKSRYTILSKPKFKLWKSLLFFATSRQWIVVCIAIVLKQDDHCCTEDLGWFIPSIITPPVLVV